MSQSSIPYGSQQLPDAHGDGFAMPWLQQLALQSADLNKEHEAVLKNLNGLLRALSTRDRSRIAMACTGMSAAARAHFTKEEALMLAAGYPDRAAHIEQHDELMRRLARIRYVLIDGIGSWSPTSELSMLERCFVPHLNDADRRFADFIAARRTPPDAA